MLLILMCFVFLSNVMPDLHTNTTINQKEFLYIPFKDRWYRQIIMKQNDIFGYIYEIWQWLWDE